MRSYPQYPQPLLRRLTPQIIIPITLLLIIACQKATPTPTEQATSRAGQSESAETSEPAEPTKLPCATVTTALHMRTEPSEKATVITWLTEGETVIIVSKHGQWWMIASNGQTGYARAEYLKESERE